MGGEKAAGNVNQWTQGAFAGTCAEKELGHLKRWKEISVDAMWRVEKFLKNSEKFFIFLRFGQLTIAHKCDKIIFAPEKRALCADSSVG